MPLAYLITFVTYGTWLHGDERGSVDKQHNQPGEPFVLPDPIKESSMLLNLREKPYLLDERHRKIVIDTIVEVCQYRQWRLIACHVRTNHVHVIVHAQAKPEKIMSDCKAYSSRRLREQLQEPNDRKRWTQHGSTRYLWKEENVASALEYVISGQGEPMELYDFRTIRSEPEASAKPSTSEPEALAKRTLPAKDHFANASGSDLGGME